MKASIIIPAYKNYSLLHQLLWDIYKKCDIDNLHEVIIIDDSCTNSLNGLDWWFSKDLLPLKVFKNKKNRGFLLSSNMGLKRASGDILVLISTDVRIYRDCIQEIINQLKFEPKSLCGGRLLDGDTGWNRFGSRLFPYIEGWILATTREGWEELDYFDEIYAPNDFEDIDISATASKLGYNLWQLPQNMLQHLGAQSISYGVKREALTKENKEKFREKWMKNE